MNFLTHRTLSQRQIFRDFLTYSKFWICLENLDQFDLRIFFFLIESHSTELRHFLYLGIYQRVVSFFVWPPKKQAQLNRLPSTRLWLHPSETLRCCRKGRLSGYRRRLSAAGCTYRRSARSSMLWSPLGLRVPQLSTPTKLPTFKSFLELM